MVQPLDFGIIASVKAKYKCRWLLRVFDNIDCCKKSNYIVDILSAIRCPTVEWSHSTATIIRNCVKYCHKTGGLQLEGIEKVVYWKTLMRMEKNPIQKCVRLTRSNLKDLLKSMDGKCGERINEGKSYKKCFLFCKNRWLCRNERRGWG